MSRTNKKSALPAVTPSPAATNGPAGEVLTLAEAAAYLRLSEADTVGLVHSQDLPGRYFGSEWRFLKAGLQDWLRTPARPSGKEAMLALVGAWKENPDLMRICSGFSSTKGV